jgi:DNA-directed RNA polymerase specialized sigma24 family protein
VGFASDRAQSSWFEFVIRQLSLDLGRRRRRRRRSDESCHLTCLDKVTHTDTESISSYYLGRLLMMQNYRVNVKVLEFTAQSQIAHLPVVG